MYQKYLSFSFVNKVYDKVSYLQKNKNCFNLEITFQKKDNFPQ